MNVKNLTIIFSDQLTIFRPTLIQNREFYFFIQNAKLWQIFVQQLATFHPNFIQNWVNCAFSFFVQNFKFFDFIYFYLRWISCVPKHHELPALYTCMQQVEKHIKRMSWLSVMVVCNEDVIIWVDCGSFRKESGACDWVNKWYWTRHCSWLGISWLSHSAEWLRWWNVAKDPSDRVLWVSASK